MHNVWAYRLKASNLLIVILFVMNGQQSHHDNGQPTVL
jgi:hypothetical protein